MIKITTKNIPEVMHIILDFVADNISNNDFCVDFVEDGLYEITKKDKIEILDSDLSFFKLSYNHDLSDGEFQTILLYLSSTWGMYLEIKQGTYQKNKKIRAKGLLKHSTSPPLFAFEYQGASPNIDG